MENAPKGQECVVAFARPKAADVDTIPLAMRIVLESKAAWETLLSGEQLFVDERRAESAEIGGVTEEVKERDSTWSPWPRDGRWTGTRRAVLASTGHVRERCGLHWLAWITECSRGARAATLMSDAWVHATAALPSALFVREDSAAMLMGLAVPACMPAQGQLKEIKCQEWVVLDPSAIAHNQRLEVRSSNTSISCSAAVTETVVELGALAKFVVEREAARESCGSFHRGLSDAIMDGRARIMGWGGLENSSGAEWSQRARRVRREVGRLWGHVDGCNPQIQRACVSMCSKYVQEISYLVRTAPGARILSTHNSAYYRNTVDAMARE